MLIMALKYFYSQEGCLMEINIQEETKKWTGKRILKLIFSIIIFTFALMICIGHSASSLNFFYAENKIAYLVGCLIGALGIAYLLSLVIKRRTKSFLKYSIILLIVVLLSSVGGYRSEWRVSDIENIINYQKSIVEDTLAGKEIVFQDFDEKIYGKSATVLKFLNGHIVNLHAIVRELGNTIIEQILTDSFEVMSKELLANQKKIAEYNARYETLIQAINKAEEQVNQLNNNLKNELTNINVPVKLRESLILGIRESDFLTYFQNMKELSITEKQVLNFLAENRDKYVFQGNNIVFNDHKVSEQYNLLVDKHNECLDKQNQLMKNILNKAEEINMAK